MSAIISPRFDPLYEYFVFLIAVVVLLTLAERIPSRYTRSFEFLNTVPIACRSGRLATAASVHDRLTLENGLADVAAGYDADHHP